MKRSMVMAVAAGLLTIMTGAAHAAAPAVKYLCKNSKTGNLYVRTACVKGETKIKNISTLKGETGEQGIQGATGPTGPGGGSVTGTFVVMPVTCTAVTAGRVNGMLALVDANNAGTSIIATFGSNGKFAMYNVPAGTYKLIMMSVNNSSYVGSFPGYGTSLKDGVVVVDAQATDVGTVSEVANCCGNGVIEGNEQCDVYNLNGKNCTNYIQGSTFSGGELDCWPAGTPNNLSCTFYTGRCTPQPN